MSYEPRMKRPFCDSVAPCRISYPWSKVLGCKDRRGGGRRRRRRRRRRRGRGRGRGGRGRGGINSSINTKVPKRQSLYRGIYCQQGVLQLQSPRSMEDWEDGTPVGLVSSLVERSSCVLDHEGVVCDELRPVYALAL